MYKKEIKNKILIIDDSKVNLTILERLLEDDYEIHSEDTPEAGLEAVKTFRPDLILCDYIMPRISGFDIIQILKEDERTADIPIIFLTASADAESEERGLALGAVDFIAKPYEPKIVRLRVSTHIRLLNSINQTKSLNSKDDLTGLEKRNRFDDVFKKEWSQSIRQQWPISFLMIEIDNFKKFCDVHGCVSRDIALQNVAKLLKVSVPRITDSIARWEEERFAVILPNAEIDMAIKVAERICKNIELATFIIENSKTANVTVSIGVNCAIADKEGKYDIDSFIVQVEAALREAKSRGQNRVVSTK